MSNKFHNTSEGPKICTAKEGNCPITRNTSEEHYVTFEGAQEAYEKEMEEEFSLTKTFNKENSDSKYLAPIEIKPIQDVNEALKELDKTIELVLKISEESKNNFSENNLSILEAKNFLTDIVTGEVPEFFPYNLDYNVVENDFSSGESIFSSQIHQIGMQSGYFSKITKEVAKELSVYIYDNVLLDPFAGRGYFVKAMREQGVKTIGSDNKSIRLPGNDQIEELDALESLKKYGKDVDFVAMNWVSGGSEIDYKLYKLIKQQYPHITILHIGEGQGGCTGSEKFWDEIYDDGVEIEWNLTSYKTNWGLNDDLSMIGPFY